MKKTIILMILVLSIIILSGCINDKISSKNTSANTNDSKNISSEPANVSSKVNINSETNNNEIINKQFVAKGPDWCVPGEKLSEDDNFTIVGITTYEGITVCSAEMIYNNGKSVKYFSKDGKFKAAESKSESNSGSAYSEASVRTNSSR